MTTALEQITDDQTAIDSADTEIELVATTVSGSSLTTAQKAALNGPIGRAHSICTAASAAIDTWIAGDQSDPNTQVSLDITAMQQALFNVNAANMLIGLSELDFDDKGNSNLDLSAANVLLTDGLVAALAWNGDNPPAPPVPPDPPADDLDTIAASLGYTNAPAWSDPFTGPDIDTDNWNIGYMTSLAGGPWTNPPGSPQAQVWDASYAYIDDTFGLVLKAQKVDGEWHAGIVQAYGNQNLTGKKLFLAKVLFCDCSDGLWPALWALPDSNNTYPPGTEGDLDEIDVQEGGLLANPVGINEQLIMHFHRTFDDAPPGPPTTIPDLSVNWGIMGWEEDPEGDGHVTWYFFESESMGGAVWSPPTTGPNYVKTPYNHFPILNFQIADGSTTDYHTQLSDETPDPAFWYCREFAVYVHP